ncbi:MAG TPA: phage infection protein [Arcobacter sp.]|nr:phage infection protein [Arcobacter sp.]
MDKLNVKLENCYGINKLEEEFDFTRGKNITIYAPNATMKTSFSKTFLQLSKNKQPEEKIHNKTPVYDIKVDGIDIESDEIFVIESMNEKYKSDKLTTLLVDSTSMERYSELNKEIIEQKKSLFVQLNKFSGIVKTSIENNICDDFNNDSFFELLKDIDLTTVEDFSKFKYKDIFDSKVVSLLSDENISENISGYYSKYNELIDKSPYFKKDVFNPVRAENIIKSTKNENFFDAEHKVHLNGHAEPINSVQEFQDIIAEAKKELLANDTLKEIEKKISQGVKSVKEFQDLLEKYPELIPYLTKDKYHELRQLLWLSYLKKEEVSIESLLLVYKTNKEEIKEIEDIASSQSTKWEAVVEEFEQRFYVPYEIYIDNKKSMVLGNTTPIIKFRFIDPVTGVVQEIDEDKLSNMKILSQGEKRALYLLHIIFEVKARIERGQKTLFIIDDIADSFDYKNKYAIIEYLKEISEEAIFNQIILTHNFDFFRTVQGRILGGTSYSNSFMVSKTESKIELLKAGPNQVNNPFNKWKEKLSEDNIILIAFIPFIRNIAEYIGDNANEDKLTKLLHIKSGTKSIEIQELEVMIKDILKDTQTFSLPNPAKKIYELIYEQADYISIPPIIEEVELEKKIVLSIAIRLKAEEYMIHVINNLPFTNAITKHQTAKLFKKVKGDSLCDVDKLKTLELVNLITPENIHLNSFMYEPILDMSKANLIDLYKDISTLHESI